MGEGAGLPRRRESGAMARTSRSAAAAKSKVRKVKHHPALPYGDREFIKELSSREGTAAAALEFLILTGAAPPRSSGPAWPGDRREGPGSDSSRRSACRACRTPEQCEVRRQRDSMVTLRPHALRRDDPYPAFSSISGQRAPDDLGGAAHRQDKEFECRRAVPSASLAPL